MPRRPQYRALAGIDRKALEAFQAGIRKRYTDEQILVELAACAKRLGRSPTMREFAADDKTSVHPQTVIEHFGSWNEAKRKAGLVPRRFATREELLQLLRGLGEELGRIPTARDIEDHRGRMPSKSLYWHTFGSLANALREAGFDVPVGEEKLERALEQGMELARRLGRLPKFADWSEARKQDETMLTEWQIYRMFEGRKGAWSTFQFLVRERLVAAGTNVAGDGTIEGPAQVMRLAAATVAVAALAAIGGSGPARAGFPASQQRLVLISEDIGFPVPALVLGSGKLFPFGLPLGIHGSVAISPDGTQAAMVETVAFFPGETVPSLVVASLVGDADVLNVGKVTGRTAWSPDGTKLAFAGNNSGNWDIYVIGLTDGRGPGRPDARLAGG